jgi:glycosyltransferase involved in cell wall biosynthesis
MPTEFSVQLSIVIPLLNEELNIRLLYDELASVLVAIEGDHEIIFIDDGSTDQSFHILRELQDTDDRVRIIRFRRNFGQTAAIAAGFDHARGEVIVTMDADLQNDPHDIPLRLEKNNEGDDLVSGWRSDRQD